MNNNNTPDTTLCKIFDKFYEDLINTALNKINTINMHEMQVEGWLKTEITYFLNKYYKEIRVETEKRFNSNSRRKVDLYLEFEDSLQFWIELKFWIGFQKGGKFHLSKTYLPLKGNFIRGDIIKMNENDTLNSYFIVFYSNPPLEPQETKLDLIKGIKQLESNEYKLQLLAFNQYEQKFCVFLMKFEKK